MEKCKPNNSEIPFETVTVEKDVKKEHFDPSLLGVYVVFLCNWIVALTTFRRFGMSACGEHALSSASCRWSFYGKGLPPLGRPAVFQLCLFMFGKFCLIPATALGISVGFIPDPCPLSNFYQK